MYRSFQHSTLTTFEYKFLRYYEIFNATPMILGLLRQLFEIKLQYVLKLLLQIYNYADLSARNYLKYISKTSLKFYYNCVFSVYLTLNLDLKRLIQ